MNVNGDSAFNVTQLCRREFEYSAIFFCRIRVVHCCGVKTGKVVKEHRTVAETFFPAFQNFNCFVERPVLNGVVCNYSVVNRVLWSNVQRFVPRFKRFAIFASSVVRCSQKSVKLNIIRAFLDAALQKLNGCIVFLLFQINVIQRVEVLVVPRLGSKNFVVNFFGFLKLPRGLVITRKQEFTFQ